MLKIKNFPYTICESGIIRNKKGRIIFPSLNKKRGYYYICLSNKGVRKNFIYHRLVAEYLVPKVRGKDYINHIDGNKLNNIPENLEWCTMSENQLHAVKTGLRKKPKGNRKYSWETICEIRRYRKNGYMLKDISNIFDIPISTVTHICLGSRRV